MPTTQNRHPVLTLACTLLTLLVLLPAQTSRQTFASTTSASTTLNTWQSAGPYGGSMASVAVDPVTPTTIFAGAEGGSIFKSADRGATWNTVYRTPGDFARDTVIDEILVAPWKHTTIYAHSNAGIYRSIDGGTDGRTLHTQHFLLVEFPH